MTDQSASNTPRKLQWSTPALVSLEMGLSQVQLGNDVGTDGGGGLTSTSAS